VGGCPHLIDTRPPARWCTLVSMIRASELGLHGVTWPVPRRADTPIAFIRVFGARRLRGSISPAAVNALSSAIQNQEGYYPGSLAYQNNNPGNLVYAGQPGATRGAGGFAAFDSYSAGLSALQNQITLDATRGTDVSGNPTTTISELLSSWAPSSDPRNNTPAYIASVASQTGYDPNAPLSSLGLPAITAPLPAGLSSDATNDDSGIDLSSISSGFDSTVDLSGVGLPSSIPVYALAGVGILAAVLIFRR
jgi:hypothetical protein